jgi:hypothetical protein
MEGVRYTNTVVRMARGIVVKLQGRAARYCGDSDLTRRVGSNPVLQYSTDVFCISRILLRK